MDSRNDIKIEINGLKIVRILIIIAILLITASITVQIIQYASHKEFNMLTHKFYVDNEANLPTFFSSFLLLLSSILLLIIYNFKKKHT